ncbi:MAG: isopentenyl phosphate kinase [Candidatus Diapherotrites archaeon]|nr:isopentenyl phosphate kinase [Candidatus Diapherotrites archaeon]
MERFYVLKLGGSIVTKKGEQIPHIDQLFLKGLIRQIAQARAIKPFRLILISGVGSIGHGIVVKWGINDGVRTPHQKKGVQICLRATKRIGFTIVRLLKSHGMPAKFVDPSTFFEQRDKKLVTWNLEAYETLLDKGIIPVSTGSMVPDSTLGWSVMSGDRIIARLSKHFSPDYVLLGTDVDGVFTSDPKKDKRAKRISRITNANLKKVGALVGESMAVDVTRGMKGKLEEIVNLGSGAPVRIFSLKKKGALRRILEHPSLNMGTLVRVG